MSNGSNIDDETYKTMSDLAYQDQKAGDRLTELPGWQVLEGTESNSFSGFDAVTFYNPETKEAVIAYRGTEGSASLDRSVPDFVMDGRIGGGELIRKGQQETGNFINNLTPEWLDKGVKGVKDFTGISKVENWADDRVKDVQNWTGDRVKDIEKTVSPTGWANQMYQAEDYANQMQSKHKDLDFSMTGHSLGGGNAQYASAYTGIPAVTFSAPSVMGNLTPEVRRQAEAGAFDGQVVNYASPSDLVASGTLGGYDRHVGSTYYINSDYDSANDGVSIIDKAKNSFGGENYHSLDQYDFKNGYISNDLYDPITGERVRYSPRLMDHMGPFGKNFGPLRSKSGGGGGVASAVAASGLIQVTPEELKSVASRWKQNAQQCNAELNQVRTRMAQYLHTSRSRRLEPIVTQLDASIHELGTWHMKHTSQFLNFIDEKADAFRQADESPVHF
ncbi:lipase family protein [Paenibacillus sp. Z3-2]